MIFRARTIIGGKTHERTEKSYLEGGTVLTREDVDKLSGGTRQTMTSFTIPEGMTSIGAWAFDWCDQLATIVQPGSYAEAYCKENNIRYSYGT